MGDRRRKTRSPKGFSPTCARPWARDLSQSQASRRRLSTTVTTMATTPCCQLWARRLERRTCPSQRRANKSEIGSESKDSHAGVTSAWKRERGDGSVLKRPDPFPRIRSDSTTRVGPSYRPKNHLTLHLQLCRP